MSDVMAQLDWELVYVLPNLELPSPDEQTHFDLDGGNITTFEQDQLFITSGVSEPAEQIRSHIPAAEKLLSSFSTPTGRELEPAILVVDGDAPDELKRNEQASVAFRNAVALLYVLQGRAQNIANGHTTGPTWSNTFDFHPTTVGLDGSLMTLSPALQAFYVDPESIVAVSNPELPVEGEHLYGDPFLERALGQEWRRRYLSPREDERFGRRLFISLQVAFQASSIAVKNRTSVQEYGLQVSQWISAIEILAQPESGYVRRSHVLDLLGRFEWNRRPASGRWYVVDRSSGEITRRGNLVQRLYTLLYHARNKFIHGEQMEPSLLTPVVSGVEVVLPRAASLVYRAALAAYLGQRYEASGWEDLEAFARETMARGMNEEALLQLIDKGRYPLP